MWPRPTRGSDVVTSVYIYECGVPPWEVELGTRWPTLGLGRDYLLLGSALWNLRWKCSCLSRNENKEFIFVSVKVVTKMPCDRIRGWSRLIKSEFCLDEKFVKCSVVITSCRTGIKMSPLPRSAFLKLVTCKYEWFKTSDQNFPKLIVDRNYKLTSGRFESHLAPRGRFQTSGFLKSVYKQNQLFLISLMSNIKHRDAQPLVSEFNI